ncbi:MAG: hypothetical protein ACREB7_02235 [Sphingopyxis sp.]|uniref:hypothetical protein n=1 Tax=Sphingopyxis sp. TaxID=1908224 RepID=UPI003D6CD13C
MVVDFRLVASLVTIVALSGCVKSPISAPSIPVVTVDALREAPEAWDGKQVRVTGWLTYGFENMNLYASRQSACSVRGDTSVIGAITGKLLKPGTMRQGIFEGRFSNYYGVMHNDEIVVSTGHASPGPLKDILVVQWTSRPEPVCD